MTDKVQKPAIRFTGFTDNWEQSKAETLFQETSEKGFPWLPVLSATQDRGMIKRAENGININHDKKNEEGYKHVVPGQFVIHLRSFQGGFAHSKFEGITSPAYTIFGFSQKESHDDSFWKYIFTSRDFIRRLESVTYGIRDGRSISYNEFLTMKFSFPTKQEQVKISTYFSALDNLITLHQRKCEKLKNIKKSMLQKMFPKNGEKFPEVRFAGFTDAWEQRKLGELTFSVDTGKSKFTLVSNGIYAVLGSTAVIGYDNNYDYEGDFLLTARVGANAGELYRHTGQVKISDNTVFIQGHNIDFIYYLLMNFNIKKLSFGTGQPLVKASELKQINLLNPINKSEQTKIGTFFQSLDNLITLHQRKVEKLQNIKKACLEKMFV